MKSRERQTMLQVYSAPIEREILRILMRTDRPLRTVEIHNYLPDDVRPRSSAKLYYHLEKLRNVQLVDNDKIHERLSLYTVSDKARKLLLRPQDKRDKAKYLASLVAPHSRKNRDELVEAILDLLE